MQVGLTIRLRSRRNLELLTGACGRGSMSTGPLLAVVIVSWNVRDLLAACLRSLQADLARADLSADIWVVDNGSADGTPEVVARDFPAVRLIARRDNPGFAPANNQAMRAALESAPPRYFWLLNPDTEILPGATAALITAMESCPHAGVARNSFTPTAPSSIPPSAFRDWSNWPLTSSRFPRASMRPG